MSNVKALIKDLDRMRSRIKDGQHYGLSSLELDAQDAALLENTVAILKEQNAIMVLLTGQLHSIANRLEAVRLADQETA